MTKCQFLQKTVFSTMKRLVLTSLTHHSVHSAGVDFRLAVLDVAQPGVARRWKASVEQADHGSNYAAFEHIGELLWVPLGYTAETCEISTWKSLVRVVKNY